MHKAGRHAFQSLLIVSLACFISMTTGCKLLSTNSQHILVFDKTPVTHAMAVDVDSFRGDVTVTVDPLLDGITVEADLLSHDRGHGAGFDNLDVSAKIETDENGFGVLRVLATSAEGYTDTRAVDLTVTMPQIDGLRVQTRDGRVTCDGVRGAVTVLNHNGEVRLRTMQPLTDPVSIATTDGRIAWQVTPESTGVIDAESTSGQIRLKANGGSLKVNQYGRSKLTAVLNDGANPVTLRTTNDKIYIFVDPNPMVTRPLGYW